MQPDRLRSEPETQGQGPDTSAPAVDLIVPCYNEDPSAVDRTVRALSGQTLRPRRVIVVDDCSRDPAAAEAGRPGGAEVVRLPENGGISKARNVGLGMVDAPVIGFVNVEVLPDPEWLQVCVDYLAAHPRVGVVEVFVGPEDPRPLLARWRMRYHEAHYPDASGPVSWTAGHAMIFRADAIRAVGGFDEDRRKAGESLDICFRLKDAGWEVHYVAETRAVSIQQDTFRVLARAEYNRSIYRTETGNGIMRGLAIAANRMVQRSLRHVVFFRWPLLLVEPGVFVWQLPWLWRHR